MNIKKFFKKIYSYALGDLKSGIWWHKQKKFKTHNIKALTVLFRYLVLSTMFYINFNYGLALFLIYCLFAFNKVGLWGIVIQIVSDFAIIYSFLVYVKKLLG